MSLDALNWPLIGIGCAGGVVPDLVRFAKARYETSIGDYFTRWNFWVGLLVLVALGGLAAAFGGASNATEALVYGYAAPEFFSRLVSKQGLPTTPQASLEAVAEANPTREQFSVRRWWTH
jgi:hypothetical protein